MDAAPWFRVKTGLFSTVAVLREFLFALIRYSETCSSTKKFTYEFAFFYGSKPIISPEKRFLNPPIAFAVRVDSGGSIYVCPFDHKRQLDRGSLSFPK